MREEYDALKRRLSIAYLAWLIFGLFGAHRFYLKRWQSASVMLGLSIGPYIASFIYGFILGLADLPRGDNYAQSVTTALCHLGLAFWLLVDLFLIPGMVEEYNLAIARSLHE